jgi:hypothetical protein
MFQGKRCTLQTLYPERQLLEVKRIPILRMMWKHLWSTGIKGLSAAEPEQLYQCGGLG